MKFTESVPHESLSPFIDAYWHVRGEAEAVTTEPVLPDGCVDIIINRGDDYVIEEGRILLKGERAYLGGAITHAMKARILPETHLAGIRFKPSAFACFYSFSSLHETTDQFIELPRGFIPDGAFEKDATSWDAFFMNRIASPKHALLPVIDTIKSRQGNIAIRQLAELHCTTVRQLERNFKYHVGLAPKEFAAIVRSRYAHSLIKTRTAGTTLSDIAFECGYFDQSHLTNEVKKYMGSSPLKIRSPFG